MNDKEAEEKKRKRAEALARRKNKAANRVRIGTESGVGYSPALPPKPEEGANKPLTVQGSTANDQQKSSEKNPIEQKS